MAFSQELRMVFKTEGDKQYALTLANPRDNLSQAEVEAVMDLIIDRDVIQSTSGGLVEIVKAYIVDRAITNLLP